MAILLCTSPCVGHDSWILLSNSCHVCNVEKFKPGTEQQHANFSQRRQLFPGYFRCYALCAAPWVTYVAPRYQKIEAKKITVMRSSMGTNMKFRKLTPGHTMQ